MSCFLLCGKYFANNDFIFLGFCWPQPDMGIWYLQQRFYRHLHRSRFATKAFLLGRLSHVEMWQHIVRLPGAQGLGRPTWYRFGYQRHQKQMKSMCNHLWACQQPQWALQAESHGLRKFNVDQTTKTKAVQIWSCLITLVFQPYFLRVHYFEPYSLFVEVFSSWHASVTVAA